MKKFIAVILFISVAFASSADELLNNLSGKVSEFAAGLVPGEGITEVDIKFTEQNEPSYSILAVRDINKTDSTNLFTQFSILNTDISSDERTTLNLGLGYRLLSDDESMMVGFNSFIDTELSNGHQRGSVGFEAKGAVLDFSANYYVPLTLREKVEGTYEQSIGGTDWNLFSQVPYMPWAKFGFSGYRLHRDKASNDTIGRIYTMNMALTPTLELDISRDKDIASSDGVTSGKLTFVYPPKDNKPTLADGFTSDEMWHKESMKNKLSEKVRRKNNLTVEIQGAVIFTKK